MKLYHQWLYDEQIKALRDLSFYDGRSVSEHIRKAIDAYLVSLQVKVERIDKDAQPTS